MKNFDEMLPTDRELTVGGEQFHWRDVRPEVLTSFEPSENGDSDENAAWRLMDDQILLSNGREAIAAVIPDAFRVSRIVRNEFEVRPVEPGQLAEVVQRQHAIDSENFVVGDGQCALHEVAQFARH